MTTTTIYLDGGPLNGQICEVRGNPDTFEATTMLPDLTEQFWHGLSAVPPELPPLSVIRYQRTRMTHDDAIVFVYSPSIVLPEK